MNVKFLSSYNRSFDELSESLRAKVSDTEEDLIISLKSGIKPPKGLGLKKIKGGLLGRQS